jgi:hypothetical protein
MAVLPKAGSQIGAIQQRASETCHQQQLHTLRRGRLSKWAAGMVSIFIVTPIHCLLTTQHPKIKRNFTEAVRATELAGRAHKCRILD